MKCTECKPFQNLLSDVVVIQEPTLSLSGFIGLWKGEDGIHFIIFDHSLVIIVFRASEDTINFLQNLSSPILGSFPVCDGCMASLTYITMYTTIRPKVPFVYPFHFSSYQQPSNS